MSGFQFNPLAKLFFWLFVSNFFLLSYTGACPVEFPFTEFGRFRTRFYFAYFFRCPLIKGIWERLLKVVVNPK